MNFVQGAGPTIRGYSVAEDFAISLNAVQVSTGGTAGANVRDMATLTGAGANNVFSVQFAESAKFPGTVITNLTPGVATFTPGSSAAAAYVSSGLAMVQASNPTLGTKVVSIPVSSAGSQNAFNGYIAGSVAAQITAMIDGALGTATPATCVSRTGFGSNAFNSSLWCKGITDLTFLSRDNGWGYFQKPLISPRHCMLPTHMTPANFVGKTFCWTDNAGNGYLGTISQVATVGSTDVTVAYIRDATLGEISAYSPAVANAQPLSAASISWATSSVIKPALMFPATTWAASNCALPLADALANWKPVPVMMTCNASPPTGQGPWGIGVWDIYGAPAPTSSGGETTTSILMLQSALATRAPYSQSGNVGISQSGGSAFVATPAASAMASNTTAGMATFAPGAGWPILLGINWLGVPGADTQFDSPWYASYLTQINTAMQSTAQAAGDASYASYQVTTVGLTGYTTY